MLLISQRQENKVLLTLVVLTDYKSKIDQYCKKEIFSLGCTLHIVMDINITSYPHSLTAKLLFEINESSYID